MKKPFFALKIDMMKAYDHLEWSYLHQCLAKLGFAPSWIEAVMQCVTNVRYAVRLVGYRVPAKPLRFELWGAHEDLLPTETRPKPRRDSMLAR